MAKKRLVTLMVDEGFFKVFEKEREKEQGKLRRKTGGLLNLSQRGFTELLVKKNFQFTFPKKKIVRRKRR